jgi:hypothetical protein
MKFGETILVQSGKHATLLCTVQGNGLCRSCGAEIIWVLTPAGNNMPIDEPEEIGDKAVSHFSTCPDSDKWRKLR